VEVFTDEDSSHLLSFYNNSIMNEEAVAAGEGGGAGVAAYAPVEYGGGGEYVMGAGVAIVMATVMATVTKLRDAAQLLDIRRAPRPRRLERRRHETRKRET
jgi:hypothetical protein